MSEAARAHLFVSGRVQGVFYRATTARTARELGLDGWVKNLRDGRVEAVAQGARPDVEALIEWSRRGPAGARVEQVEVEWEPPQEDGGGFDVRY